VYPDSCRPVASPNSAALGQEEAFTKKKLRLSLHCQSF
jgi:hypothetical protein